MVLLGKAAVLLIALLVCASVHFETAPTRESIDPLSLIGTWRATGDSSGAFVGDRASDSMRAFWSMLALTLRADQTCDLSLLQTTSPGEWRLDGQRVLVVQDEDGPIDWVVRGDNLLFDVPGHPDSRPLVFERTD